MSQESPGKIITFYSYKGGTGRTMALANAACLLAQDSNTMDDRPVLLIDWDLEAPGLHRFFRDQFSSLTGGSGNPDDVLDEKEGLIDIFWRLRAATEGYDERNPQRQSEAHELLEKMAPESLVLPTDISGLFLLKSGQKSQRADDKYSEKVNTFGWESFHLRAPFLIRSFGERMAKLYRYVLIDSRTGLTDVSGICTMLLPERLVFVFTPNRQSIQDGLRLIERATNYRRNSSDLRPLVVFPLASRVEAARDKLRQDWRMGNPKRGIEGFQPQFEKLFTQVYQLKECQLEEYFTEVQIQHNPDYAYGEVIAAQVETTEDRLSLKRSYRTFVDRLVNSPSPWLREEISLESTDAPAKSIVFPNGHSGVLIEPTPNASAKDILRAVGLNRASALILLVGVAGPDQNGLIPLLRNSLPGVVADLDAIVLDSGTQAGPSALIGEGIADWGRQRSLLGVAPKGQVTYPGVEEEQNSTTTRVPLDPNHSNFVLVDGGQWGDEIETKFALAKELSKDKPVVAILAGDGAGSRKELLRIVKQSWPIVVVEGSGQLANEVAALNSPAARKRKPESASAADSVFSEIISDGDISVFPTSGRAPQFERMVCGQLPAGQALDVAWSYFDYYSSGANESQRQSYILQFGLLVVGCVGVIMALAPSLTATIQIFGMIVGSDSTFWKWAPAVLSGTMVLLLYWDIVLQPGLRAGDLRFAAETIISEIFQYRTRSGIYSTQQTHGFSPESRLLEAVATVEEETAGIAGGTVPGDQSANRVPSVLPETKGSRIQYGYGILTPERYISNRLEPMLDHHALRARRSLARKQGWRITVMLLAMAGTALSLAVQARGIPVAISITLALAGLGVLGILQPGRESRTSEVVVRNLKEVKTWWDSLPTDKKGERRNIDRLVADTEEALSIEWQLGVGRPRKSPDATS